jgi:hypothetical protein
MIFYSPRSHYGEPRVLVSVWKIWEYREGSVVDPLKIGLSPPDRFENLLLR